MTARWGLVLCIFLMAVGCKKAFNPPEITSDKNSFLVIEGVIDNGTDSTVIKLSRTQKIDSTHTINAEARALVSVESDGNSNFKLTETVPGRYAAPPVGLDAARKYRLHIKTADHREYISDYVAVKNSPPIDSVGFDAQTDGVQIYLSSHDAGNNTHYYRWDYSEAWQFHSKYPSGYFLDLSVRKVSEQVYNCFSGDSSTNVVLGSSTKLAQDIIYQTPITKIPATAEKIETKYSILVRQYALSSDAYAFWLNLQNNTEKLGSIFDVQPSDNQTNYHCISNPAELVVGYLSVGRTVTKRVFITADQLLKSYVPQYPCACQLDTVFNNPPHAGTKPYSDVIGPNSPYSIVSGLYLPPPDPFGHPTAYTYSIILCVDCTVRGKTATPAFWR
jgi:hypothetical protein